MVIHTEFKPPRLRDCGFESHLRYQILKFVLA
ncbi:hypothetical protein VPHD51_0091 [Vibrio phage D51]